MPVHVQRVDGSENASDARETRGVHVTRTVAALVASVFCAAELVATGAGAFDQAVRIELAGETGATLRLGRGAIPYTRRRAAAVTAVRIEPVRLLGPNDHAARAPRVAWAGSACYTRSVKRSS